MEATSVTISNTTLTTDNTEYSIAIPANTTKITLKSRTSAAIKLAFVEGESGSSYVTIPASSTWADDLLAWSNKTIYVQSAVAGIVVELLTYQRS